MAKTVEDQMISDAIAGTEQEIFSEATADPVADAGGEEATKGDRSLEEMGEGLEGQHEASEEETEVEAAGKDNDAEAEADEHGEEEAEGDEKDGKPGRDKETGQFKAKDGKAEDDGKGQKPAADAKAVDDGKGKVPSGRLREETEKRKAAETERDAAKADAAAVRQEVAGLSKRLDDLMNAVVSGRLTPQGKPGDGKEPAEEQAPDIFADPEGYQRFMENKLARVAQSGQQSMETMRVELSMQAAHDKYEKTFENAYGAVTKLDPKNPNDVQTVRRIWSSPNPGRALISWYNQQQTLREVGDDPAAYRAKIEAETQERLLNDENFLNSVMEKLRDKAEGSGKGGKPRAIIRTTPSLNGARGGGMGQLTDRRPLSNNDADIFEAATSPD